MAYRIVIIFTLLAFLAPGLALAESDFLVGELYGDCRTDTDVLPKCDDNLICIGGTDTKLGECLPELPEGPTSAGQVLRILDAIGDWVFAVFISIAVIFIIIAIFDFVTGGGDPAKISSARQKLIYAAIGIALALVAGGLDNVLSNIIGT